MIFGTFFLLLDRREYRGDRKKNYTPCREVAGESVTITTKTYKKNKYS